MQESTNDSSLSVVAKDGDANALKPLVVLFYVTAAASVWKYFTLPNLNVETDFLLGEHKTITAIVLFGLIPMGIVKWGFRERLADYGLSWGKVKFTLRSFCVMAPAVAVIAYWTGFQPAFFDVYPLNETLRLQNTGLESRAAVSLFWIHAVFYLGYYFGWEFLFRGFLQHGLQHGLSEKYGLPAAIFVQTLASTVLHYGHPDCEIFGSIAAGLVWGFLAVRTKSILSGFGQHALLGIVLDWTLVYWR